MSETNLHVSAGEWEEYITCPYCGSIYQNIFDCPEFRGDTMEMACTACARTFRVTEMVSYSYKAEATDNDNT